MHYFFYRVTAWFISKFTIIYFNLYINWFSPGGILLICYRKWKMHAKYMGSETKEFNHLSSLGIYNPVKLRWCETLCFTAYYATKFLGDNRQVTQTSIFKANCVSSFLWLFNLTLSIPSITWKSIFLAELNLYYVWPDEVLDKNSPSTLILAFGKDISDFNCISVLSSLKRFLIFSSSWVWSCSTHTNKLRRF